MATIEYSLSSDLLREFSNFLKNEHKFVVEGKDGKPCIKDPLYKKAYKSVPECRFPKKRGQNSIIGTMSRFHAFSRYRDIDEEMAKEVILKLE